MEYTKGEWKVEHEFGDNWWIGNGDIPICSLEGKNIQANAQLIAAAPEMYEALKAIYSYDLDFPPEIVNQGWKAIAEAEGK